MNSSCTKPGGWVEFQDWDCRIRSEDGTLKDTALERYYNEVVAAFERAGYPASPGRYFEEWFREAGFVDIHVRKYPVPMGVWPKDKYFVWDELFFFSFFISPPKTVTNFKFRQFLERNRSLASHRPIGRFRGSRFGRSDEIRIMEARRSHCPFGWG